MIEFFKELEGRFPDQILPDIGLDLSLSVLDLDEARLPEVPDGNDPASQGKDPIHCVEFFIRERTRRYREYP